MKIEYCLPRYLCCLNEYFVFFVGEEREKCAFLKQFEVEVGKWNV